MHPYNPRLVFFYPIFEYRFFVFMLFFSENSFLMFTSIQEQVMMVSGLDLENTDTYVYFQLQNCNHFNYT